MKDRQESIPVENVNLDLLIKLVSKVQNPDVEKIEKSEYKGVRLFYYDDKDPTDLKVYATKNFFNNPRYQVPVKDINASIIKEVQTLILHEVSHLWGFGEENGEMNYARTFAVRMVNILHGSMKVNFTQEEKLQSLSRANFHETHDIFDKNAESIINNREFQCVKVSKESDLFESRTFKLDRFANTPDGYPIAGLGVMRRTIDGYLLLENSTWSRNSGVMSTYLGKKGAEHGIISATICHESKKELDKYIDRFIRPYFTKTNLLTDLDHSSLVVYQSLLISEVHFFSDTLLSVMDVNIGNQNQIIQNIDYKIKVEMKDEYQNLTSRKYKYSKDKDSAILERFNPIINSDLSTKGKALYSQITVKINQLNAQISAMKNIARQIQMNHFLEKFVAEFNEIVDRTQAIEEKMQFSALPCFKHKAIGKFYECQLEVDKVDAKARIEVYERMQTDISALAKKYSNEAAGLKD